MSQNAQKLFNYLQENESNPEVFGDFDVFQEQLKDPEKAEKLRNYLGNEKLFGDSATFYNRINEAPIKQQENTLPADSNIVTTTKDDSGTDILDLEMKNPGASAPALAQINNPDYETNQVIDSSDHGYFQINNKYWDDTSSVLFNKPVQDLNNLENIAIASYIEKKSPNGWNNWVAFNKGKHKDFDGVTDEQLVNTYKVPVDVVQLINESFDDPQTAKQVMLAESGGDSTAINVNYTPQEEGKETVSPQVLQQSESLLNQFKPTFETAEPASTQVSDIEVGARNDLPISATARQTTEFLIKGITGQYTDLYNTSEFENSKEVVDFATNMVSTIAEFSAMPIDMVQALGSDPVGIVKGLIQTMPEEFLTYAQALNIVDVVNPVLSLANLGYSKKELEQNRQKAQKYIFDTGGVYAYFAATGLTSMGRKTPKVAQKNKELADVVELANDRPAKNAVNAEQQKAAQSLKNDPNLLKKAEQIVSEQLEIDFLEPTVVDDFLKKADEAVSTSIDLDRDIPTVVGKKQNIDKKLKETQKNVKKLIDLEEKKVKPVKRKPVSDEIVQQVKIKKSSDLSKGKDIESIKGESARRYKSKEKLDAYIEEKLGEYVGQNVIARYGVTQKGDYLVKIFQKTKEQPLPTTATKRPPLKIDKDSDAPVVNKMRDPRSLKRRIQNQDMLAEKYSSEISELNRNLNSQIDELFTLEAQALDSGIQSPRINLIKNSIDATTKLINKSQSDLRLLMTSKDLLKRVAKNVSGRSAKGAVGRNVGKTTKEKLQQRLKDKELIDDIKQLWSNGKTGYKINKKGLIRYLKEIGSDAKTIRYVNANYKRISDEAFFDNAKKLSSEIAEELPQSPGQVKGTTKFGVNKRPSDDYFANIRVEIMSGRKPDARRLALVDLFESLVNNVGELKTRKAKGTRTLKQISENSQTKQVYARYVEAVHFKKDLKFDIRELPEIQTVGVNHLFSLIEEFATTRNNSLRKPINEALLSVEALISEPARALRNLRDIQAINITDFTKFEKFFPDNPDMLEIIRRIVKNEEIDRSVLFQVAEYARNAKLATGSSVVRSLVGNTFAALNVYARMPFELGYDWMFNKSMGALHELTNGQYGNLSKNQINRLESAAMIRGHLGGFKKASRLAIDMFFENDNALRQSAFFRNEGFMYKDIKGKKGVVIRTPQRIQGIIDIMYRVPLTEGYFRANAVRQAVREGYKKNSQILKRADEIIKTESLDGDLIDSAIRDGKYNVFQSELEGIGRVVNGWRGGNQWYNAVGQILIPFFNTAGNLFRYTLEHTPANFVMKDFRRGFVEAFTPPKSKLRRSLEKKLVTEAKEEGTRTIAKELSKVTTGLGAMYLMNRLILDNSNDNISGDWSDMFPEERNMRTNLGQQEYSIRLDDGNWVSYRGFEPISSYLTLLQSYQKTALESQDEETKKQLALQAKSAVTEIAKSFAENPFLAGTGDLFKALHGRKDWAELGFSLAAGAALPGIVRQYASIIDDKRRSRLRANDINENIDYIDVLKSQGYNTLPFFTDKNLNALDPFGREIDKPDPVGGIFAMRYTEAKSDPVYQEIQKVFFDRDKGFQPASPLFTANEFAKIGFTPEEHWTLIKVSGEVLYDAILQEMQKPYWQETKPAIRARIISKAKNKITDYFRQEIFASYLGPIKEEMINAEIEGIITNNKEREEFLQQKRDEFERLSLDDLRKMAQKSKPPNFTVPYLD